MSTAAEKKALWDHLKAAFNLVTVDDFVQVIEKKDANKKVVGTQFVIGDGAGGWRRLNAEEAREFISDAKDLEQNRVFQSIVSQIRYKGQETSTLATDSETMAYPRGLLYAADLAKRVVAAVKNLQVEPKNEPSHEGQERA